MFNLISYWKSKLKPLWTTSNATIRMAKVKSSNDTRCGQGSRETGLLICSWLRVLSAIPFKMKDDPSWEAKISLLDIYSREMKMNFHIDSSTHMLIATWFIIAPNWKPHQMSFGGEWSGRLCCSHGVECTSAVERQNFGPHCSLREPPGSGAESTSSLSGMHAAGFLSYSVFMQ